MEINNGFVKIKNIPLAVFVLSDCACFINVISKATGCSGEEVFEQFSKSNLFEHPNKKIYLDPYTNFLTREQVQTELNYNFEYIHKITEEILIRNGYNNIIEYNGQDLSEYNNDLCIVLHDGPLGPLTHYTFLGRTEDIESYIKHAKQVAERYEFDFYNVKIYIKKA